MTELGGLRLHDRRWRLNNLYYITDKSGTKIKFELNWAQEELFEEMHFLNIVLKARQLGFTTFIVIFMLDACLFNETTSAGIIAHTRDDAEEIFGNKVKFAYDNLPPILRDSVKSTQDSARKLAFSNGSSIRVGTSMRSGTLQYLLVSEHGKICARYPDKAKEIRTGALNAVEAGQFVYMESTAEGREGDFFNLCEIARNKKRAGKTLTSLDFKFHFFPWWRNPEYQLDPGGVPIPAEFAKYFVGLEKEHGIALNAEQKAWYVKKAEIQDDEMKREYPSTSDEAFEASISGAYYAKQMAAAWKEKRITAVPWEPTLPVNTIWDLGMDDSTTIWFHQRVGLQNRFIRAISGSGESLGYYANQLRGLPYTYGEHYLPHDVNVRELGTMDEHGKPRTRKRTLEGLGVRPIIVVPRTDNILEDIDATRRILPKCWMDEENCAEGIKGLENYRKEWDDKMQVYKSYPRHDWASHWADPLRIFARGYRFREAQPMQAVANSDFSVFS